MCLDPSVIFSRLDMRETACPWVSTLSFHPDTFPRFKTVRGQAMEHALDTARSGQEIAVRCCRLTKTYGTGNAKVMALRGVDREVRLGELLMLVGPSGCGKTTLILIIAAILNQDSGGCEVFGQELQGMDQRQRTRFRGVSIGFVFQLFNLLPALSAIKNVSVPLLINSVSRKDAEGRASQLLTEVDLGERLRALPAELSGGQQQRVAIARALVYHPKLIVCDEPTSSLDLTNITCDPSGRDGDLCAILYTILWYIIFLKDGTRDPHNQGQGETLESRSEDSGSGGSYRTGP